MDRTVPVVIVAGFLGAGKTTLLNHVLSGDHGLRIAALVNDFGAINIDAQLVVGVEGESVTLANGCVCCTIRDDLAAACLKVIAGGSHPDLLLIELSGVSDPLPVANLFMETELANLFRLDCILAVTDATQMVEPDGVGTDVARRQLAAADLIVLNKVELVPSRQLAEVRQQIDAWAVGKPVLEATHGRVPTGVILNVDSTGLPSRKSGRRAFAASAPAEHSFVSVSWSEPRALSLASLRETVEGLPASVLRCKGILHLEELPVHRFVLQMVGKRYELKDMGPWGDAAPRSDIVLISSDPTYDHQVMAGDFEGTIGAGHDDPTPMLRLMQRIAPEYLNTDDRPAV